MANVHYCSECDNTVEFGHDCPTYVVFVPLKNPSKKPDTTPNIMTKEQWNAMFVTSVEAEASARTRSRMEYLRFATQNTGEYDG